MKFERENNCLKEMRTLLVSVTKIQDALTWLKENNVLYSDIDILPSVNLDILENCSESRMYEYINGSVEHQLEEMQ